MSFAETPRPARPTLEYLSQNRMGMYVLNKTTPPQDIMVTITQNGSLPRPEMLPRTWIPIDLRTFAHSDVIMMNRDITNLLRKNVLKLLWPEEAQKIFDEPEAQEEMARIAQANNILSATETPVIDGSFVAGDAFDAAKGVATARAAAEAHSRVTEPVLTLMENYRNGTVSVKAVYSEVRTLIDTMTEADLEAVIRVVDDVKTREFCAKALNELRKVLQEQRPVRAAAPSAPEIDPRNPEAHLSEEERRQEQIRAAALLGTQLDGAKAAMDEARAKLEARLKGR